MEGRPYEDPGGRGSYTRYGDPGFDWVPLTRQGDENERGGGAYPRYATGQPPERSHYDSDTWYDHGEYSPEVEPRGAEWWGFPASRVGGKETAYEMAAIPYELHIFDLIDLGRSILTSLRCRQQPGPYSPPYRPQASSKRLSNSSATSYTGLLQQDQNSSYPSASPYGGSPGPRRRWWQALHSLSQLTKFNCYAITSTIVLLINLGLTITAVVKHGLEDGIGTLREGSCSQIKRADASAHYGINFASTLLLGASNYCMQCLCAPTRDEVDAAHKEREWLDIGVQSTRNLRKISGIRVFVWWCLSLSSVPLHLLYNSAVFDMLAANEYNIAVVSEDFLTGAKWNTANSNASSAIQRMWEQSSKFERLDRELCIKAYGSSFVSDRNDVIVVSEKTDPDNALLGYLDWAYPEYQNSWICNTTTTKSLQLETIPIEHFDCSPSVALEGIESWVMAGEPVSYCLSRPVDEKCRLQFSLHIMIVVIVCNAVKSVCMIVTGKWVTGEKKKKGDGPLIVVGDAVASFLETEDERTKGMCLLTKREVEGGAWRLMPGPRKWEPKRKFWFLASWKRWVGANVLCLTSLGLIGYLFSLGLHRISVSEDIGSLWRLGFGTITPSTLIPMKLHPLATNSLLANVLIANLPQALMSVIYLSYNGVFTCMLVAKEWSRFADQRRGLRVTEPKGSQTSSHFLSLPYAYAAPLLVFSVTIHWLVSQSIFLAQIVVFSPTGQPNPSVSVSTCGYSPIAIIFAMAAAGLLVASNLALGFRRYRADIPLVGSCSVAISAACHRSKLEGPEIAYEKVQWGVVRRNEEEVGSTYGHCSFSAEEVEVPEIGVYYAGESSPDLRPGAEGGISF